VGDHRYAGTALNLTHQRRKIVADIGIQASTADQRCGIFRIVPGQDHSPFGGRTWLHNHHPCSPSEKRIAPDGRRGIRSSRITIQPAKNSAGEFNLSEAGNNDGSACPEIARTSTNPNICTTSETSVPSISSPAL
jgi:hypothetical protein